MTIKKDNQIGELIARVDPKRMRRDLFFLASDPLPSRVLNYVRPGSDKSTLHEADDFIIDRLESLGYEVERELVKVQAFQPDLSVPHGFRRPLPDEPWYDSFNLYARRPAVEHPANVIPANAGIETPALLDPNEPSPMEAIVLLAHKDSQSWLDRAPGASDNAVGVVALLEIARLMREVEPTRTVIFLFCNEEHWPWTSVAAAERLAASSLRIMAVINVDSIGGKSLENARSGIHTNTTRYSTPEGERIADLMGRINELYEIGLDQEKAFSGTPNDDDGSFINAGILPTVLNIGSFPYADPNYHTLGDKPEYVDLANVVKA
ncbi:MAG: M28 family metallopeptidase, partial [Rhodothermia bacterium]